MNEKQKRRESAYMAVRENAQRPKKNRQAQKDEIMASRRERALRGDPVPGVAPSSHNKPKWKDRSGYRTK